MLSHELRAREAKLRKEQQERIDKEKQRKEKERLLQERQKQREAEREAERARKAQEQLEAERLAQERMEQLTEANRGVYYSALLQAVPQDEAAVAARGIKRASDKVTLPASVGALLMELDASRNGAPMFEIVTPGGSRTHASALEFTAPEGVVALPRKVADCLWGAGTPVSGPVTVTYKRLEKGTFVRFQPLTRGFHEAAGELVREVLERALMQHTALTEGDVVKVQCFPGIATSPAMDIDSPTHSLQQQQEEQGASDGSSAAAAAPMVYELLVQELQPDTAVSLIDTDMEAQVVPSLETEQALRELEAQRERLEQERQERERVAAEAMRQAAEREQRQRVAQEQAAAEELQRRERHRAVLEATLPPEPPLPGPSGEGAGASTSGAGAGVVTAVFRMPDGTRVPRRFALDSPASLLFHFCDAKGAGGLMPGSYRLVLQFPRRVVDPGFGGTLAEAGLQAGQQEALMLEPLGSGLGSTSGSGTGEAAAAAAGGGTGSGPGASGAVGKGA